MKLFYECEDQGENICDNQNPVDKNLKTYISQSHIGYKLNIEMVYIQ